LGRVLAIDMGSRRVGLALSDESGVVAQPFRVVEAEPAATLVRRLADISTEVGAAELVVGLPRRLDGSLGPEAKQAQAIASELRAAAGLPVALVDERLSTAQADKAMIAGGRSRSQRRARIDAVAAALLLQDYLAMRRGV
jgi:putative Holliday junction resolvase